jgi:hypothetical protein
MNKKLTPAGSRFNLTTLFSDIQDASENNRLALIENLFESYGVLYSGGEEMEVSQYNSTSVEVKPGMGICSAGHLIKIQETSPIVERVLSIEDGYNGPIYVKHVHTADTPVDIVNGFVWTSNNELTANSNQFDDFELTTTDPGVSGIELASVIRSGSVINVTDTRSSNKLTVNRALLDNDTQSKLHAQNTDTGTTSPEFRVGVGVLNGGLGYPVKLSEDSTIGPLSVRLENINIFIPELYNSFKSSLPISIRGGIAAPEVHVTFAWGYKVMGTGDSSGGSGTGGKSIYTITTHSSTIGPEFKTFALNELAGQRLYIPGTGDYLILSNDPTNGNQTTLILDTDEVIPDSGSDQDIIHCGADQYAWECIPVDPDNSDSELSDFIQQGTIDVGNPIRQTLNLVLNLGWKYTFRIISRKNGISSPIKILEPGSFYKNGVNYTYTSPFFAINAEKEVDMTDASVSAVATDYGFDIAIAGMDGTIANPTPATDFEIVYRANADPDFNNSDHPHMITTDRLIPIQTNTSTEYRIRVRPLIGGLVASPAGTPYVSTSVISGGGGEKPNDKVLPAILVDLRTESQNLVVPQSVTNDANDVKFTLNFNPGTYFFKDNYYRGKNAFDSEQNLYFITGNTDREIDCWDENPDLNVGERETRLLAGVYIGDSNSLNPIDGEPNRSRTRLIYQYTFSQDVTITYIDYDSEYTDGTPTVPGVIRFYQKDHADKGKTINVESSEYFYNNVQLNFDILGSRGSRVMIIDGWDTTGTSNGVDMRGLLTVHYRDKVGSGTLGIGL